MPIYEYECRDCHKRFEKLQKLADKPCKKCPSCGGPLRKLISSPAIQFKGSGFYITDYAKKSSPETESKAKATSRDDAKDAPKSEASGEKPAKSKKAETIPADKACSD
jgi:putative FmdB family regulatory protein